MKLLCIASLITFSALHSCAPVVSSQPTVEPTNKALIKRYQVTKKAFSHKEFYFDQRLDSITLSLHGKRYDESIRTLMAGVRDRAKSNFSKDIKLAKNYVKQGGQVPAKTEDLIELATWMKVTEAVENLTHAQQQAIEEPEPS